MVLFCLNAEVGIFKKQKKKAHFYLIENGNLDGKQFKSELKVRILDKWNLNVKLYKQMTSGNDFSDKCDNTWTPIENLEAALVGYDLPSGNPFASDFIEDPGLKKQIFNATIPSENEDENYKLDSGISIREYEMCDDHFKIRLATSIKGYKKVILFLF